MARQPRNTPKPVVGVVPGHGSTIGGFEEFLTRKADEEAHDDPEDTHRPTKKSPVLADHNLESFLKEVFDDPNVEVPKAPLDPNDPRIAMPSMAFLKEHFKTQSAIIRYLHSKGFQVKDIAKHMNTRYQHVRNVLTNQLKRGPNEPFNLTDWEAPKEP